MANDSESKFSIKNILNKMSVRDWIILVLVIVCIGLFISQRYYREKADNIRVVYSDTIYQYKNKLDSAYVAKDIYVQTIKDLKEGMELNGIVTNVTNFGAFVDLGIHVNGLIHVSQMGGTRRNPVNPANVLKIQQSVKVKVLSIDINRERIGLALVK
jgi:ribosomal protein S1